MTDHPPPDPSPPPALVDTTPATPERTGVTYAILLLVLSAILAYFVVHMIHAR